MLASRLSVFLNASKIIRTLTKEKLERNFQKRTDRGEIGGGSFCFGREPRRFSCEVTARNFLVTKISHNTTIHETGRYCTVQQDFFTQPTRTLQQTGL
jgi:hypothetical protein